MAKQSGLNVRLYVEGNDLSGDANSLTGFGYSQENYDTTTLDLSAMSRIIGRVDSSVGVSAFFDSASTHISAVATANSGKLPAVDQDVLIALDSAIGSDCFAFVAKQSDYNVSGSTGSPITVDVNYEVNGNLPDFGKMLTAFTDTHSSASSNASLDNSASSASGGTAYLQVFSLASGTVVFKVEHSTNNASWSTLATFTGATGVTAERVAITGTINRYVRLTSTGTFSNAVVACALKRD